MEPDDNSKERLFNKDIESITSDEESDLESDQEAKKALDTNIKIEHDYEPKSPRVKKF